MKKKYLLILATSAILALSGCANSASKISAEDGQSEEPEEATVVESVAPTSVRLDHATAMLKVNETIQLTPTVRPIEAYDAKFSYTSSDEEVATVDENGLVTGLKEGKAVITVKSVGDNSIADKCVVYVGNAVSTRNKALTVGKMNGKQRATYYDSEKGQYVYPNTIKSAMSYKNSIVVDGKIKESFDLFRDVITSESNAYFSMDTKSTFVNTFDGGVHYQNYQYQMLANPGRYDSYIFYTSDSRKNVYYANTGFMADEVDDKGEKLPLNEVVLRLLDSLFSTGRELATDNQERSLESKYLSASQLNEVYGTNEQFLFGNHIEYKDQNFSIGTDQESSYQIPAGTPFKINLSYDFIWEDGVCKLYVVHQKMEYNLDGKEYVENYDIEYSLSFNDDVELNLPNVKDYNLVTDLYDL